MVIQGVSYLSDFEAKKAIIAAAAKLEARGFLVAGDGSLSVRVGPNAVWVTMAGADKSALTQDMLVRVDLNGRQMASAHPKPLGDDLPIHLKLYKENELVQSVVHAYPPCAAVLGVLGQAVEAASFSPAVRALGRMQLLPAQQPDAAADAVSALCRTDKGVLLQNDGCMTWGKTPAQAAQMVEALDYYCKVQSRLTAAGPRRCSCGRSATGYCDGSCKKQAAPAPAAPCSGDCPNCGAPLAAAPAVPAAASAAPLTGVTGVIRPGEALPPLPPKDAPAPAAPAPAPAAVAAAPAAPAQPVAAVDVPREDVMAEVIRRTLQTFA